MALMAAKSKPVKTSVLLPPEEAARFDAYCRERGYKKSTLIARLIREYLNREGFSVQRTLFDKHSRKQDGK